MRKMPKTLRLVVLIMGGFFGVIFWMFEAPLFFMIAFGVMLLAFWGFAELSLAKLFKNIQMDLYIGQKVLVEGELTGKREDRGKSQKQAPKYYWQVDGEEFVISEHLYGAGTVGAQVRLHVLRLSRLVFRTEVV